MESKERERRCVSYKASVVQRCYWQKSQATNLLNRRPNPMHIIMLFKRLKKLSRLGAMFIA